MLASRVSNVRTDPNFGVFVEPIYGDDAHANLVIYEKPVTPPYLSPAADKQGHEVFRKIAEFLQVQDAADLTAIKALRIVSAQPSE
jgi:hypothetical protein